MQLNGNTKMEITTNKNNFVSYTNIDPIMHPVSNIQSIKFRKRIEQPETEALEGTTEAIPVEATTVIELPKRVVRSTPTKPSIDTRDLLSKDIEDIFKQAGITFINGKRINFGSRAPRAKNAKFGAKNSNHKKVDPHTGYAMARDISIAGGSLDDYTEFRRQIMSNELIRQYLDAKNWGIINEVTPQILARTRGKGAHFHFGPDTWARRTWNSWKVNPNISITTSL